MSSASKVNSVDGLSGSPSSVLADLVDRLTARLQAGEVIDWDGVLRDHPEHAEELGRLRPALGALDDLSRSGSAEASGIAPPAVSEAGGVLGDFRIVREIGRGGMGVVYEAEQISLGRLVALKVLPFAGVLDPRHVQRFQNEARAAACLHHPNVVPVHAVGQERGVHFYAMQMIEGRTLAELVRDLRGAKGLDAAVPEDEKRSGVQPPPEPATADTTAARAETTVLSAPGPEYFRTVARLGVQAAEALDYAHQIGVIHRDIKPGNLMLDGHGTLWVTDFGLAHLQHAEASLTMTGDLVGTLRYMSPEQILGKRVPIDHRTDVYSLGATLYELLTLQPAFVGNDRQELLGQIASEEPQPPRRVNKAIPHELETIVLKALEKNPAERYATAQELADDLWRFLEDKPIHARKPTLRRRAVKWARRHQRLLRALVAFLLLTVTGLAVSVLLIWRQMEKTGKALAEARANYAAAEAQGQRAEANFREAFWLVEDLLMPFDTERNLRPLSVAELREWQTERALQFFAAFSGDQSDEPDIRLERGRAFQSAELFVVQDQSKPPVDRLRRGIASVHAGRVYQVRSEREKALAAFRQAIAVFNRLVQDFPDNATYARELGWTQRILADELYRAGEIQDAKTHYGRAVSALRKAAQNNPSDPEIAYSLATWLSSEWPAELGDPECAVRLARKAVELAPGIPRYRLGLGIVFYRSGDWSAAVTALEEFLQLKEGPWTRTRALLFLAMAQWQCGKQAEAKNAYEQAVRLMENRVDARDYSNRAVRAETQQLLLVTKKKSDPATPSKDR